MNKWYSIATAPKMKIILMFAITSDDPLNWKMATGTLRQGYPIKPSTIYAWSAFPRRRANGIARALGVPVGELLTEQQRARR